MRLQLVAEPYAHYFCKKCECKSLTWAFSDYKNCDSCGHNYMSHFCWFAFTAVGFHVIALIYRWNREILKPIQKYGTVNQGAEAYQKLGKLLRFDGDPVIAPSDVYNG